MEIQCKVISSLIQVSLHVVEGAIIAIVALLTQCFAEVEQFFIGPTSLRE